VWWIIAMRLRGKHKAQYTPHVDCGDNVIVINADKVKFTGRLDDALGEAPLENRLRRALLDAAREAGVVVVHLLGLVVGRLASIIAMRLRGKHKAQYTPHVDCGDNVIVSGKRPSRIAFAERSLMPPGKPVWW
jgi:ribosomal protein L13